MRGEVGAATKTKDEESTGRLKKRNPPQNPNQNPNTSSSLNLLLRFLRSIMTSNHPEPDSIPNWAFSNPRSGHPPTQPPRRHPYTVTAAAVSSLTDGVTGVFVRLMCSFGGCILPCTRDNKLCYVGGDTRIVSVRRSATFSSLLAKLSKLDGAADFSVKYQLPNEDLDALITVTTDEDVENMMDEFDRTVLGRGGRAGAPRLRLFLFTQGSGNFGFGPVLDRSPGSKRDSWFVDALNGGPGHARIDRGRSKESSVLSEIPDYLSGIDIFDELKPDCGAHVPTSPTHGSTSSLESNPPVPDLPPVKAEELSGQHQAGYEVNPMWQFEPVPVYYIPGPVPVQYYEQTPTLSGCNGQPVQGGWINSGQTGPVYVGEPVVGQSTYNYQVGTTMAVWIDTDEIQFDTMSDAGGGFSDTFK